MSWLSDRWTEGFAWAQCHTFTVCSPVRCMCAGTIPLFANSTWFLTTRPLRDPRCSDQAVQCFQLVQTGAASLAPSLTIQQTFSKPQLQHKMQAAAQRVPAAWQPSRRLVEFSRVQVSEDQASSKEGVWDSEQNKQVCP